MMKTFLFISLAHQLWSHIYVNAQQQQWPVTFNPNQKLPINILLLLPVNDTYKFSLNKVLASLLLAIDDLKSTDYGARFKVDIVTDSCDCGGIKAPINAMENIFGKRNHTKQFQAVFGPMCD